MSEEIHIDSKNVSAPEAMPKHYWPRSITVTGEGWDGTKLSFLITTEEFEDNLALGLFTERIGELRRRLWSANR